MKFTTTILSVLVLALGGCKSHKTIHIIDGHSKTQTIPFVYVYSSLQDSCIAQANIDGIYLANIKKQDSLHFEFVGYKILKLSTKDLRSKDSIFMYEREADITLGSSSIKLFEDRPEYKCAGSINDKNFREPQRKDLKAHLSEAHNAQQKQVAAFIAHIGESCSDIKADPVIVQLEINEYGHLTHFAFPEKRHNDTLFQQKQDCIQQTLNSNNPEFGGLKSKDGQAPSTAQYSITIE